MGEGDRRDGDAYERVFEIATGMPAMHEHLVSALDPRPGERWLDVATGTGRVALLAAARQADVSAQDIAPGMIATARRLAAERGLQVAFDVGDCRALRYTTASFEVVSSAVGAIFAPDHRAVAGELGRVCRPGGRIGLVAWRPDEAFAAIFEPFEPARPEGAETYSDWGREEHVHDLLGADFELRFEEGNAPMTGRSGEEMWEVWRRSIRSTRELYESLDAARRDRLREAFVRYFEGFRGEHGIEQPNPYLLILGTRV